MQPTLRLKEAVTEEVDGLYWAVVPLTLIAYVLASLGLIEMIERLNDWALNLMKLGRLPPF